MKLTANKNNLRKHARALLGNNYSPEREVELIQACLNPPEREYGHISHWHAKHLAIIDKVLGNFGVEGMLLGSHGQALSGTCSDDGVVLDCQYSNTGETYALTIMYVNGKLCIGDWGRLVERLN